MDNYQESIEQYISDLNILRKDGIALARKTIGETLFSDDLYALSLLDKCLRLIDGFIEMLKMRNLTCVGALLRLQLDNCMRTYAMYVVEDKQKLFESVLTQDIQLNKLKSRDGQKLSDHFLKTKLTEIDSQFETVYKQSSAYIHHSEKSFYTFAKAKDNSIEFGLGLELRAELNPILHECAQAFIHFVKLQYKLTLPVVDSKQRYDNNH